MPLRKLYFTLSFHDKNPGDLTPSNKVLYNSLKAIIGGQGDQSRFTLMLAIMVMGYINHNLKFE